MQPIKKFLFPRLYPKSGDVTQTWFIKYLTEDYTTGTLKHKKYYGALNLIADAAARNALAQQYMEMMHRGETLPNYQGMKNFRAEHPKTFANAVECCYKYVRDHRHEIENETASQYRARINVLAKWLQQNNLQHLAIGGITKDVARQFLNYLKGEKNFANKTYNDYKALLGTIWEEYINDGKLQYNPWRKIAALPDATQHFESYPPELREFIRQTLPAYDPQLWLFMQTIYYCAIRPHCELRLMQVRDLNTEKQRFVVRKAISKTGKERTVNIYNDLYEQYTTARYHHYPAHYYLFTKQGYPGEKPVTENYFTSRWNAYRRQFDIPAKYKLYGSKHTGGKRLSLLFNEYVTKEHFGHSSMDSTRHYISDLDKNELTILQQQFPKF